LLAKDFERWQPTAPNFRKAVADYPPYTLREQLQFARQLYGLRADLVHFTMPQQPLLYFGRHITTVHDLTLLEVVNRRKFSFFKDIYKNKLKPAVFKVVLDLFVQSSVQIITPTNTVREQLLRTYRVPAEKVTVTYEAAEALAAEARKPDFVDETDRFVMYVGNAYPYKNVWRLIEAFRLTGRDDLKLVLVGKKEYFYTELEERAKREGVKNVIFAGFTPDDQLVWLYQHAQVFATASLLEGWGLPGLEAMFYGVPTLASRASCMPEVYGDGARYFDPLKPEDIAKNITEVLDDVSLRSALAKAGLARAKQFSWRRMAEQTLEVYQQALK
jgi:glycosyltransferase involved in cell wall biosynthesis